MSWIGTDIGATPVNITFQIATVVVDDGEGGDASGTSKLIVPVRLVPVSGGNEVNRIIENNFPGANTYDYVFYGWVKDQRNYKFPKELRQQRNPIGECELPNLGEGRIECSIGLANEYAAKQIGEKFTAIFTRL